MSEKDKEVTFRAKVVKCVYNSTSFKIYAMDLDEKEYPDIKKNSYGNVSIMGELHDLTEGVEYDIQAVEQSSKYGLGYKVIQIRRDELKTIDDIKAFLQEILTERQADALMSAYPDIIDRVRNDDIKSIDLTKLKGIGEKTLERIKNKIIDNFYLIDLVSEFKGVLSMFMLKRMHDKYSSIELLRYKLKTEPYTTLMRISGVGFKRADAIVVRLQNENVIDFECSDIRTSSDRCLACVLYLLEENENEGNTKANLADIRKLCIQLTPECSNHFVDAIKDDNIYYNKETMSIALRRTYEDELKIANAIKYGLSVNKKWDFDWKKYQIGDGYNLSDEQIELLHYVCEYNVVILSGCAGAGKSKSTEMLIKMLNDNYKTFLLASPTGKSAKVLANFTGVEARTVHRTLGYNPQEGWFYNEDNKIDCDLLLIDEMSMISVDLMKHIIDAIDFNRTKMVMIGDPSQLPSVQAGNLLHDFLNSNKIPTVKLTKIFRYGNGGILTAATNIRNNQKYLNKNCEKMISFGEDSGYVFVKSSDETIVKEALALYKKLITVGINGYIYKPNEIALLTAYNKGDYGTIRLNNELQKIANKNYGSDKYMKHGSVVYYIGDITMQCKNDYKAKIYYDDTIDQEEESEDQTAFVANGECSEVTFISKNFIVNDFDNMRIRYNKENLENISLAYSYSIHRSQGSTIKAVILITPRSHVYMLNANLLYTGVTRASDKCFHFGLPSTINMAMTKKENFNRLTFIEEMLIN